MIMTPQSAATVLNLVSVRNAQVGHIIETFRQLERQHMLVVDVDTSGPFLAAAPELVFVGAYILTADGTPARAPNYDIEPDGQHFLMIKSGAQNEQADAQITVVLNWFQELTERVPVP